MHRTMIALIVAGLCASPAFAQTKTPAGQQQSVADCQANFKAADKNADGKLSKAELEASSKIVPTSLASQDGVTQQQFMTACNAGRPKGG
jgi:hypothetical protein